MNAAVVSGLAVSRACDYTDALPVLRPPDRVDGVAGTFGGVEGRRAAGAAPGGGGAAAAEPQAQAGLADLGLHAPVHPEQLAWRGEPARRPAAVSPQPILRHPGHGD